MIGLLCIFSPALPAQTDVETVAPPVEKSAPSLMADPWDFFYRHHIEGVGLVLIGGAEATGKPGLFGELRGPVESLSVPDPVLGAKGQSALDRFVLIARLQNSLDVDEVKAQAATYQWVSDAYSGDFWNLDAALILDWYFPSGPLTELVAYRSNSMAAHLRTGISWERISSGGTSLDTDLRELFVGVGFHAPPDPESIARFQNQSEFQIGISYKDDAVADSSSWSVDLNIQPVFKDLFNIKNSLPFAIGETVFFKERDAKNSEAQALAAKKDEAPGTSPLEHVGDYFYIKPNFTLKSVFDDFAEDRSVDAGDYQFDWGARFGVGFCNDALRLSYQLTGVTPLERAGSSFVFQEVRAEYRPTVRSPLLISARYTRGERAPAFVDEDRVTLSVGIKF